MYRLPDSLRSELAKPLAKVLSTDEALAVVSGRFLVTVGDVCSHEFLKAGRAPDVIVADWKTQRLTDLAEFRARAAADPGVLWLKVANPAGVITSALWQAIVSAIASAFSRTRESDESGGGERFVTTSKRRALVEVVGEEDLAALPALLVAPEGAAVAYGQPNEGVVVVIVTPEVRRRVRSLLDQMEVVKLSEDIEHKES